MLWLLSLLSAFFLFLFTNLSDRSIDLGYFIHKKGSVCPFGVLMGRILSVFLLLQAYSILKKYKIKQIKKITIILLIVGFILSFMNPWLQRRLIIVFILQLILIFFL
tara:strand:+ start:525 stop:845 length:321 start_codon:yes stop_codon:yes gene_type:complete